MGWLVYVVCVHFGLDVATASFFATLALAWFARVFAFWRKAPVTVFLITGIFPLVPGAGIYYTGYHLFMSDNSLALDKGLETIKIAVAIALGIGIVLSLPPFLFAPARAARKSAHNKRREPMPRVEVTIGKNDGGQRLDKFLTKSYPNLPQSMLYKAIRKKDIKINGKRCENSTRLQEGDVVSFFSRRSSSKRRSGPRTF